jgi:tetratricopeptide (TPR) repeat protein
VGRLLGGNVRLRLEHLISATTLCALAVVVAHAESPISPVDREDPDRLEAFQLYRQHRMVEAAALFEKIVAKYPTDVSAHEALGAALLSRAAGQSDPATATADRLFARRELLRAQELGDTSDLCRVLLSGIRENGEVSQSSANPQVNSAIREGEAAFAQSDWSKAIAAYTRAWELDSSVPLVALYLGDTYFRMKDVDRAGEWFARAIQIDPDQETPYRYWGDALLMQGDMKKARAKYIEGVAANPYQSASFAGLHQWLSKNNLALQKIPIQLPPAPTTGKNSGTNIYVDTSTLGKDKSSAAWLAYSLERARWRGEEFSKEFPTEKSYRHSLKEETAALTTAVAVYRELISKDSSKQDASLELLAKLKDDEMLEPFTLLTHADPQIAQDYPSYRAARRDKLIAFLDQYVVPQGP